MANSQFANWENDSLTEESIKKRAPLWGGIWVWRGAKSWEQRIFAIEYRLGSVFKEDEASSGDHERRSCSNIPLILGNQGPGGVVATTRNHSQLVSNATTRDDFKIGIVESVSFAALHFAS